MAGLQVHRQRRAQVRKARVHLAHTHYVQPDVGHYGVFAGKRWQRYIYPLVRNVIRNAA
jgi:poly-beta-hydroxyalkanoate depolymerase